MKGQVKECKYNNAIVRVHFPDRSKDELNSDIRQAAESFLKKVMFTKGSGGNEKEAHQG